VPSPKTKDDESAIRNLAHDLRLNPDKYESIADRVEAELGLRAQEVDARSLGPIDTFRFEERALLQHCSELMAGRQFEQALEIIAKGDQSFWLHRDVTRKAQWEASRRMAELGIAARQVGAAINETNIDAQTWIKEYTESNIGWYRLDHAQRRLEAWIAKLDEEPDERALGVVRRIYDDVCGRWLKASQSH
jgi:hypothetical protein